VKGEQITIKKERWRSSMLGPKVDGNCGGATSARSLRDMLVDVGYSIDEILINERFDG
jgi:hypothetical protein